MKKIDSSVFELAARLYAAGLLLTYGIGKIMGGQFYRHGELPEEVATMPVSELVGFDLAWTFFGYSFGYILFIGTSQIIGSILLLFEKTKIIGALILIPILLNIIVVDYFFEVSWGAMMSACFYLSALLFVLFYNREKLIEAIKVLTPNRIKKEKQLQRILIALTIVAIWFLGVEQTMLNIVGR